MRALVLSGGGLFGAWQAGAWAVLSSHFEPDLIVGASVGSLNGYALASGVSPEDLCGIWQDHDFRDFGRFHENLRIMTSHYHLRRPFALAVTDILTLTIRIYRDHEITWRHLAASCALPFFLPQIHLHGRWTTDGGLLQSLPVFTAVELGATEILGLNVMRPYPTPAVFPIVKGFQALFGPSNTVSSGVRLNVCTPSRRLGSLRDSARGSAAQVEGWLQRGREDAAARLTQKSFSL